MKYFGDFSKYDDIPYGDRTPAEAEIVYAGYTYEAYSGAAIVVFTRDGKWFQNNDWHCSCNGLEEWAPEETSPDAVAMTQGWPGLAEAVAERLESMKKARKRKVRAGVA